MQHNEINIQELWELFVSDKASLQQVNTLFEYINNATNDDENIAFFRQALNKIPRSFYKTDDEVVHSILDSIIRSDKDLKASIDKKNTPAFPVRSIWLPGKWGWAAASILLFLGIGSYLLLAKKEKRSIVAVNIPTDIAAPTSNCAMITLADGTKVFLDNVGNGQLAQQGAVKLIKLANGRIAYQPLRDGIASHDEAGLSQTYNTLSNPRGSKIIDIALSDGSRVWLNAGSSLTYPTAFTGKERKVKITGEAYFEIAHNAAMPFRVQHDDVTISVLGTHFNVNTYEDEAAGRITLLEGSVQVSKNSVSQLLEPGQQASISHDEADNNIDVLNKVNLDEVMAWKNGRFSYNNTDLKTIMRQIMRWYNVDVEYKDSISMRYFTADISRDRNLSAILKALELSSIHFRLEANPSSGYAGKIIVLP